MSFSVYWWCQCLQPRSNCIVTYKTCCEISCVVQDDPTEDTTVEVGVHGHHLPQSHSGDLSPSIRALSQQCAAAHLHNNHACLCMQCQGARQAFLHWPLEQRLKYRYAVCLQIPRWPESCCFGRHRAYHSRLIASANSAPGAAGAAATVDW